MLTFVDVETTGVDPAKDRIVEIAAVDLGKRLDGSHALTNERERLIFPGIAIPPEASAVHHIVDADVAKAPNIGEVINEFKGADFYVAHNSEFDRKFLEPHLGVVKWIDTYRCALRIWPDFPSHGNQALRYQLGLTEPFGRPRDDIVPHRALSDVIVTAAIFTEMIKVARWSDIVKWSNEPAFYTRFNFGKHKGMRFDEVPVDYLDWIARSDLDDGVKESAAYWRKAKVAA